ncbi:MAG: hypothetical protein EP346_01060 [Bacteroidetes bacterium]|nr:MAG: hypothetical protein EP346_01060 [Bacteroidota bacterium]
MIDEESRQILESYARQNLEYYGKRAYNYNNLNLLFGAMDTYVMVYSKGFLLHKFHMVMYQEELLRESGIL